MKKIAFLLALLLMFGVTGCYDETEQTSYIETSTESEASADQSESFPDNMGVNDFVLRVDDVEVFDTPTPDVKYKYLSYGYRTSYNVARYIGIGSLDLRSIVNKGTTGKDAARESHVVLLGDLLLIAIAVYDMEENTAYVVVDSTNTSAYMVEDRYYTHTDPQKENEGDNYGQVVFLSNEPDEHGSLQVTATYGFPVWHYIAKKYNSLPEDYVLTLTQKLYDGDEVVSEKVTFTLTYQDIQEALA